MGFCKMFPGGFSKRLKGKTKIREVGTIKHDTLPNSTGVYSTGGLGVGLNSVAPCYPTQRVRELGCVTYQLLTVMNEGCSPGVFIPHRF